MKLIHRMQYINILIAVINTPDIKVITGIRRCGKSKLMEAYANRIKELNPDANIILIDLTKIKNEPLKEYHALHAYVDAQYIPQKDNYLMIDEVQLCPNFEIAINSLHSEEKYDIYLTGSNAFLLSSDLATLFTGRHIDIHVFPFSFAEFCAYYDNPSDIQTALDQYIVQGGLAGAYSYGREADKMKYVRDVYQTIF